MARMVEPQGPCPCCPPNIDIGDGCASVPESERTGQCAMSYEPVDDLKQCEHYGTKADGGLCEDCYLSTK